MILNDNYEELINNFENFNKYQSDLLKTIEDSEWKKICKVNTEYTYECYFYKFPNGIYANEAKNKIDNLKELENIEKDKKAWKKARKNNTQSSYNTYLKAFRSAIYKDEATIKIDEFLKLKEEHELETRRLREIQLKKEKEQLIEEERLEKTRLKKEKERLKKLKIRREEKEQERLIESERLENIRLQEKQKIKEIILWLNEQQIANSKISRNNLNFSITELDFSNSGITTLPNWIKYFKNLTSLDLSNNKLTKLPKEIGELKKLEYLDLKSNNNLTGLPEGIGELKNLFILNIKYIYNLTILPKSILKLNYLSDGTRETLKEVQHIINEKDKKLWVKVKDLESTYTEYLNSFPNGIHADEAKDEAKDEETWKEVKNKDTKKAYIEYKTKFPNGKNINHAKQIILDEEAWEKAKLQDTQESYKYYIDKEYITKEYLGAYYWHMNRHRELAQIKYSKKQKDNLIKKFKSFFGK